MNATMNDETWIEYFTVELRMRRVPGRAIGDAVASVRELLADSGESAEEAFGTPREYAAALDLPGRDEVETRFRTLVEPVVGLFAFLAFALAAAALLAGDQVALSVPQVLLLAIPAVLVLLFAWPAYVRALAGRRWMPVVIMLIGGGAGAVSALVAPGSPEQAWLVFSPVPVLLITGAVLVALAVISTVKNLRHREDDEIVDPLRGDVTPGWSRTAFLVFVSWIFPIFAVLMLGFLGLMQLLRG